MLHSVIGKARPISVSGEVGTGFSDTRKNRRWPVFSLKMHPLIIP